MERLVVIGAGISGLATAFLARLGAAATGRPLSVTVLEAEARAGGKMWSDRSDGFVIEHGPNGFLDNKPDTLDLVKDLGASEKLLPASELARKRFVCRRGRLERLPESPPAFLKSRILTWKGKIRVLGEPFAKPAPQGDESVAAFAARRLGPEARDYLIDPMVSGIYAGDPGNLSLRAAFPRINELETQYGGLFKAMRGISRERKKAGQKGPTGAGPGGTLTSFKSGVQSLIDRLQQELGSNLILGARAVGLERGTSGYEVRADQGDGQETRHGADAVVLSCPSWVAGELLGDHDATLAEDLNQVFYAPVTVLATAFATQDLGEEPDGFGFLVPHVEDRPILGTLWDSSVFPDRAPDGQVLLRTMIGGARRPELARLDDEVLTRTVLDQLKDLMGIRATPTRVRVIRYDRGIPQYALGHPERVNRIDRALGTLPGLFLCHNAYHGIALNDCAREARKTAGRVLDYLQPDSAVEE